MKFKAPKTNFGRFWFYYLIQFVSYAILVANGRAYMLGSYFWTAVTDTLFATMNFVVARVIYKDMKDSNDQLHGWSLLAYVVGGTSGSLFAIWVTKHLYGT
jgi:hypothetical protein